MIHSRRLTTGIASALLIVMAAGSVLLLHRVDQLRTGATLEEVLYVSSPKLLKRASLGYDGLLADIYWTRAVQYYGGKLHRGARRYDLLWPLLNITTQLDPHLVPVYLFGGTFLSQKPPNGPGDPAKAIELVEYGIRNNPDDWHLYYDLGFIYNDLKDYHGAANAFERGSRVPNAHPFLKILAAQMAQHGGELETARMLWSAAYQTSHDKYIRANAAAHLRSIQVDMDVTQLERVAEVYRQRTGHFPESFGEFIRGIPRDPLGNPYKLTADGHVLLQYPDDFPFVEKGLPAGYVAPKIPKIRPTE